MRSQQEKGEQFAKLHEGPATFFVPNPWDVGTARLLAHLGFEALATTGAGYAFATGRADGTVRSEEQLAYAASMASPCDLPVTADLEDGFGDDPETVHATILEAGARYRHAITMVRVHPARLSVPDRPGGSS